MENFRLWELGWYIVEVMDFVFVFIFGFWKYGWSKWVSYSNESVCKFGVLMFSIGGLKRKNGNFFSFSYYGIIWGMVGMG